MTRFLYMIQFKPAPVKPLIPHSALDALGVRVGTIRAVESVAGSSKLLRLRVSFGDHERSILAGLKKERSDPAALVGMQTLFVINLEPKQIMGELSEGMLFDIGYADAIRPANSAASALRNAIRAVSSSASTGSASAANARRRCRNARIAKVMISAESADSGPGATSAARRSAAISRSAISVSSAATRSVLPGKLW